MSNLNRRAVDSRMSELRKSRSAAILNRESLSSATFLDRTKLSECGVSAFRLSYDREKWNVTLPMKRCRGVLSHRSSPRGHSFESNRAPVDQQSNARRSQTLPARSSRLIRGSSEVAQQAMMFAVRTRSSRPALVNGAAGIIVFDEAGRPFSVLGFIVARGRIVEIDVLADPTRLNQLEWTVLRSADYASDANAWLPQIWAGDVVRGAFGDARTSTVHEWDVAAVLSLTRLTPRKHTC